MAVVLRLARGGQKKRPFYRIVAADKQFQRNGRFLEIVGTYNPMVEPSAVTLKEERVKHWIGAGAKASDKVRQFIKANIPGFLEELEGAARDKVIARRKSRKARAAVAAAA